MSGTVDRVGPPYPTARGGPLIAPDYAGIEQRILAKMAAIDGAACYVVAKFHELTKTESGTPLFKLKTADGSFTDTANLLRNLVVEAIQGEVTL
jgi:hypothetical protein